MKRFLPALVLLFLLTGCLQEFIKTFLYQYDRINRSSKVTEATPSPYSKIDITDENGARTVGWYYPSAIKNAPIVIFFHGNVSNIESLLEEGFLEDFKKLDVNFAIFDYPKYGISTGEPSEKSVVSSGQHVYDFLKQKFPSSEFIIWGRSMGCSPATIVTEKNQAGISKLILTSPWDSFWKIVKYDSKLPDKQCQDAVVGNEFATELHAKNVSIPVLIHHGTADKVVPFERGQNLSKSFASVNFISVEGKDHDNLLIEKTWAEIYQFIHQ